MFPIRPRGTVTLSRPVDVFDELSRALTKNWFDEGEATGLGAYPVDIHEDDDHVYVDAELPGFNKDEVEVTLENGILRINAQRKSEQQKGQPHLTERRFTRVSRAFSLPTPVEEGKVDAKLTDGVLKLTLDKREEVKPRTIQVR